MTNFQVCEEFFDKEDKKGKRNQFSEAQKLPRSFYRKLSIHWKLLINLIELSRKREAN